MTESTDLAKQFRSEWYMLYFDTLPLTYCLFEHIFVEKVMLL